MSVNDASRIVIYDSRVMLQFGASLAVNSRGNIYTCNMFIVNATNEQLSRKLTKKIPELLPSLGKLKKWERTSLLLPKCKLGQEKFYNIWCS